MQQCHSEQLTLVLRLGGSNFGLEIFALDGTRRNRSGSGSLKSLMMLDFALESSGLVGHGEENDVQAGQDQRTIVESVPRYTGCNDRLADKG